MKPQHVKYFQLAAETAIPIFGYLFWSWSFYFLILFYLLDFATNFAVFIAQERKIRWYNSIAIFPFKGILTITFLVLLTGVFAVFSCIHIFPNFSIVDETIKFIMYEEMGIPQGILLLPLMVFGAYQQYKMNFLLPGKFRTIEIEQFWKKHTNMYILVFCSSTLLLSSTFLFILPEWVYVSILIVTSVLFRFISR